MSKTRTVTSSNFPFPGYRAPSVDDAVECIVELLSIPGKERRVVRATYLGRDIPWTASACELREGETFDERGLPLRTYCGAEELTPTLYSMMRETDVDQLFVRKIGEAYKILFSQRKPVHYLTKDDITAAL